MEPNMNYGIPIPLLPFLGACLYGDAAAYYVGLNEAERAELEAQGQSFGLVAWFYRFLYNVLPAGKRAEYQKIYQSQQLRALMGGQELKRLYGALSKHGLRFAPVKGADLAYRLYPDTALRMFCDWDIWFHPDDCERALPVLKEEGWRIPALYTDKHENAVKSTEHHFSMHVRGQNAVEPHFSLANFDGIEPLELWSETLEYPGGDGQRVLSPEMNLLMLARHAASHSYYHVQVPKLLTDAAVVMQKEKVDCAKLRSLSERWQLPYPGDLLSAFPEFFPSSEIARFGADPRKTAEFRRLFELRGEMGAPNDVALLLGQFESQGQVTRGVLNHVRTLNPDRIRLICHLPKHGAWGRVAWAYMCYFCTRARRLLAAGIQRDPNLQDYTTLVATIESNIKRTTTKQPG